MCALPTALNYALVVIYLLIRDCQILISYYVLLKTILFRSLDISNITDNIYVICGNIPLRCIFAYWYLAFALSIITHLSSANFMNNPRNHS